MILIQETMRKNPPETTSFAQDSAEAIFGALTIGRREFTKQRITVEGRTVRLSRNEFQLLRVLMQHVGETVTYQELSDQAFGADKVRCAHHLRMYVRLLRRKMEPDPDAPRFIITDRNKGYRLVVQEKRLSLMGQWDRP